MMSETEQRSQRRVKMELATGVAVVPRVFGFMVRKPQFACMTRDVSLQGVKLAATRVLPKGAILMLWLTLPEKGKDVLLKLRGRVCWSSVPATTGEVLAGIRLDTGSGVSAVRWTETIRERVREQYQNVPVAACAI